MQLMNVMLVFISFPKPKGFLLQIELRTFTLLRRVSDDILKVEYYNCVTARALVSFDSVAVAQMVYQLKYFLRQEDLK